jgi:glucose-1-phosphate adenylyltransferase
LLKRARDFRISAFTEKPTDPEVLASFVSRDDAIRPYLGSMGIYLFNTDVLIELMEKTTHDDFGGEVIPEAIHNYSVYGFDFDGYWEDIGTIRSFYNTNLAITRSTTPFVFHDPHKPIYTRPRFLPPSVIDGCDLVNVFLADGCRIYNATIRNSVIGLRSQIASGSHIEDTVMMGADFYEPRAFVGPDTIPLGIGQDCKIKGAIIDKNARVGDGSIIQPFPPGTDDDQELWAVRDGIVVIPKSTSLPPGTVIGPAEG